MSVRTLLRAYVVWDAVTRPETIEHGDLVWHEAVAVELTVIVTIPSHQGAQGQAGGEAHDVETAHAYRHRSRDFLLPARVPNDLVFSGEHPPERSEEG